ncbi:phospho-sugar mutase [Fournierella massiliensis]|nr:phospho-sugar mutase [Fournierella massiliensis]MCF2556344.1 phospho-sugar mutase [Fournierella massiliensis]
MQDYRAVYTAWCQSPALDEDTRAELLALKDEGEIEDRFYRDLAFGTGGLRGLLGAGSNRMNIYTVRRATQGLANYIKAQGLTPRVAISYDSRINSDLFARETARVLAANGVEAWLYPRLEPTPALSFAVRALGCGAGVCVTASHNPARYNGYKVYGADGCQITLDAARAVLKEIEALRIFEDVKLIDFAGGLEQKTIRWIPETVLDDFLAAVQAQSVLNPEAQAEPLKVVYTPLNGTGLECVSRIAEKIGVQQFWVVPEQKDPDGNFPTCPYPNPEVRQAMEKGLALCREKKPDLLLGTDPDCDRVGIAVPDGEDYRLMSGNEVGVLLLDFLCARRLEEGSMPQRPVAVTTIVSSRMATPLAEHYGVELRRTLTGFKFIGEQIGLLEGQGEADRFVFGFEESYGYLAGSYVRDKDGVVASMLICEMARWYKRRGLTLAQAMEKLYETYGYYRDSLHSFAFEGVQGMGQMQAIMENLRAQPPRQIGQAAVTAVTDYQNAGATGLPAADVLEFSLEGGGRLMIRPSGTEPKIKLYLTSVGGTAEEARQRDEALAQAAQQLLKV